MRISVCIGCRNAESRLPDTLRHILSAWDADTCELVIVDNSSTDATVASCLDVLQRREISSYKVLSEEKLGVTYARATAYKESSGRFLLFLDDDNHIVPGTLKEGALVLDSDRSIGAVGGYGLQPSFELPQWARQFASFLAIENPHGAEKGSEVPAQSIVGACSMYRKSALAHLFESGFEPVLGGRVTNLMAGEDIEQSLMLRIFGWKILKSRNMIFVHELDQNRLTSDYFIRLLHGNLMSDVQLLPYRIALAKIDGLALPNSMPREGVVQILRLLWWHLRSSGDMRISSQIHFRHALNTWRVNRMTREQLSQRVDEIMLLGEKGRNSLSQYQSQ